MTAETPVGLMSPEERQALLAYQRRNKERCGCGGLCDSGEPCPMQIDGAKERR
jgi:hypothetical protein